jgi:hypothetical protein
MSKAPPRFNLPRFKKALEPYAKKMPPVTHWRYSNGILPPPFGKLLIENPELALALAADAVALAKKRPTDAAQGDGTAQLGLL